MGGFVESMPSVKSCSVTLADFFQPKATIHYPEPTFNIDDSFRVMAQSS